MIEKAKIIYSFAKKKKNTMRCCRKIHNSNNEGPQWHKNGKISNTQQKLMCLCTYLVLIGFGSAPFGNH